MVVVPDLASSPAVAVRGVVIEGRAGRRARVAGLVALVVLTGACADTQGVVRAACENGDPDPSVVVDGGEQFTNEQGTYRMTIDPEWTADHGRLIEGMDMWYLGPRPDTLLSDLDESAFDGPVIVEDAPFGGFWSNVNVLTQRTDGEALDEYLEASEAMAPPGLGFVSQDVVSGVHHTELGVVVYGEAGPGQALCFLGVVAVHGDRAVIATLTAPEGEFTKLRPEVEPHLLTLAPL